MPGSLYGDAIGKAQEINIHHKWQMLLDIWLKFNGSQIQAFWDGMKEKKKTSMWMLKWHKAGGFSDKAAFFHPCL